MKDWQRDSRSQPTDLQLASGSEDDSAVELKPKLSASKRIKILLREREYLRSTITSRTKTLMVIVPSLVVFFSIMDLKLVPQRTFLAVASSLMALGVLCVQTILKSEDRALQIAVRVNHLARVNLLETRPSFLLAISRLYRQGRYTADSDVEKLQESSTLALESVKADETPSLPSPENLFLGIEHMPELAWETKFIRTDIFLSETPPPATETKLKSAMHSVIHFVSGDDVEPLEHVEVGSWFGRWTGQVKAGFNNPQVQERMKLVEHGVVTATVEKTQADINESLANAIKTLSEAVHDASHAVLRVGSILLVKVTGSDGRASIIAHTLTATDMVALTKDPSMLKNPETVLERLASAVRETEAAVLPLNSARAESAPLLLRNPT